MSKGEDDQWPRNGTKRARNPGSKHVEQEVVNGKCKTLREGETSVFFQAGDILTLSIARPKLESILNASSRRF